VVLGRRRIFQETFNSELARAHALDREENERSKAAEIQSTSDQDETAKHSDSNIP
jgi:hypothetical protein